MERLGAKWGGELMGEMRIWEYVGMGRWEGDGCLMLLYVLPEV